MSSYAAAQVSGVVAWAVLLLFGLLLPRTGYLMWRLWRNGEQPRNYSKSYSDAGWLNFQRMGPTAVVSITFLVIGVDVDYFFGTGNLFLELVVFVSGLLCFFVGALSVSVQVLRRPQWCIAPVLRDSQRSRPRPRRG
jgi:hypothetical protein